MTWSMDLVVLVPGSDEREALDELRLRVSGWGDRAEVLVIDPELEIWIWSDSPEVDRALRWTKGSLRRWMAERQLWPEGELKPSRPKESLEAALRQVSVRRSAAIYRQLAGSVGLERCTDRSFERFKLILRSWFGQES